MPRVPFKEQLLQAREDAIVHAVNQLLVEKGYESMTVDEVAATAGVAKASLYKHFPSKEALAAAAMIRVLDQALAFMAQEAAQQGRKAIDHLRAVVGWAMRQQLAGDMPALPVQNSLLRTALMRHKVYLDRLMQVSESLLAWVAGAQKSGHLDRKLPPEVALYTLYSRACDPVLGLLKDGGQYTDDQIVDMLVSTCFNGLSGRN